MNEIAIPYHLAIPTIFCILGIIIIIFYSKRLFTKDKLLWTSLTVFLIAYLFIVGSATYDEIYFQWDLQRYDHDNDGIYSKTEITKEQEDAMQRLTSDVGRNFSVVTGLIFGLIVSTTVYFAGRVIRLIRRHHKVE